MNEEIAIKWLKQARHDLDIAEKNITIGGYDVAAFLAHQSVEKLLKSLFAFQGKQIPRIHYIDMLGKRLNLKKEILNDIIDLTIDYTFSRYPDVTDKIPFEIYDESTAKTKVDKAKRIFHHLENQYKKFLKHEER